MANSQAYIPSDLLTHLTRMESALCAAAAFLHAAVRDPKTMTVTKKADATLVTSLDTGSQHIILEQLGPKLPIVAEETESSHQLISSKEYYLVDPLDGTTSCKRFLGVSGGQIGFGPLLGYVRSGRLLAACFYNLPHNQVISAVRGHGVYISTGFSALPPILERERLNVDSCTALHESAVLFYTGLSGEMDAITRLRKSDAIENVYRFGGFANDCTRLASGSEQIGIQFSAKPWDLSALLFPLEAGLTAIFDPFGRAVALDDWAMQPNNPLVIAHPGVIAEVLQIIRG